MRWVWVECHQRFHREPQAFPPLGPSATFPVKKARSVSDSHCFSGIRLLKNLSLLLVIIVFARIIVKPFYWKTAWHQVSPFSSSSLKSPLAPQSAAG